MERKKNKNNLEAKSNNYSNLNNMIFNNMKNKKKPLEHSFFNDSAKNKSKTNKINNINAKILKSVNHRPNNDFLINNNKLYNNTFYNNKLETYNKNTINKDVNRINNKYVIDYNESIKRARNSSAPSLKQKNNETQINDKTMKFHETSRNKKDEPTIFQNNKILIHKKEKKGKGNVSYENQKGKKEKEKQEVKNKNKIYDISHRINNIKQNYNSKTNKKYFQSNLNNNSNKKTIINGNYKDNTYNKPKNKQKKSLKNKEDNLGINLNIFKDILEKQEKISIMKKQLKINQDKFPSRNRDDIYSFNSYNRSLGENPILNKTIKNHHNKSYDNSLNNPIHNEIVNDKTSEINDEKNIEIDNEEKVLNIKEDQLTDNEKTEKTKFNKTYENNLSLYIESNKQNKEINSEEKNINENNKDKEIDTLEIDNIIEKKVVNTNLNMYNKNKAIKNKEKIVKKDKKIRIVNAPKYNDYYFTKSSNIFNIINNNLNKTNIEKNNKSKIANGKINKSTFNDSYETKKNNVTSTQRHKVKTDLYNNTTTINNNISKKKETKKKPINSSKIKKHNVKIKIQTPKIQQNKSDNKLKIKKIDKIGCICRPGEISYGKEKINQDNFFNYNMNIDDLTYIGVCDGHGDFGHFISDYLIKNLPNNFLNSYINLKQEITEQYNKISKEKITKIFEESFTKTDLDLNNFCDKLNKISSSEEIPKENIFNCEYSGSTCVSLLLPNKNSSTSFIANVGDSRVIVIREEKDKITQKEKWSFKQLSRDHKPTEEDEYNRIIEADGEIEAIEDDDGNWTGPLRVWEKGSEGPGLAMTRSLGDKVGAKIGVCCIPEVTKYEIKEEDKVFVLASDGLWEYVSNQEVTEFVKNIYEDMKKKNEIDGDKMAKILYDKAVIRWREKDIGMDDITIICVILN